MSKEAFVYLWRDIKNKMYYLGVHKYKDGDDYAHSSSVMENFTYSTRPSHMKRRILVWGTWDEMYALEQKILKVKHHKNHQQQLEIKMVRCGYQRVIQD